MSSTDNSNIDFGFQTVNKQEKQKLVKNVFDSVALKYDLMNDLTSFGIHRIWKNELINWISPQKNQKLADIAGGTGDIARKFIENGGGSAYVIDVNFEMINAGLKHKENNINMHGLLRVPKIFQYQITALIEQALLLALEILQIETKH